MNPLTIVHTPMTMKPIPAASDKYLGFAHFDIPEPNKTARATARTKAAAPAIKTVILGFRASAA